MPNGRGREVTPGGIASRSDVLLSPPPRSHRSNACAGLDETAPSVLEVGGQVLI